MKLSIVMPIFNERPTIELILQRVLNSNIEGVEKEIVIVESNSSDGTKEIIKNFESNETIKILWEDRPRGKGYALKNAFKNCTGEIILIQDGDLEYSPEDYNNLIKPILEGHTNFVLGSRHLGKKTWQIRNIENSRGYSKFLNLGDRLLTWLFNKLYKVKLTDPSTMFKVFKRDCIHHLEFKTNYFDLDWEIVAKLIKSNNIPVEVPITYNSRSTKEGKKIKVLRDGFLVLIAIIRFRIFN